jgi:hypothetical protein
MSKLVCNGTNASGSRCKAYANETRFCFMHDATKGSERALARRKGGLATKKPHNADPSNLSCELRSIDGVFSILNYALQETIVLDNSIARGRLLVSIAHGYIEALKVGELETRLETLESVLKVKI